MTCNSVLQQFSFPARPDNDLGTFDKCHAAKFLLLSIRWYSPLSRY